MRDINLEDTVYPKFTTRAFATNIPTTLAGTPVLSVYEENNLTQITAGVSVTVDYDSVTGLNQATIAATAANGYEAGKSYDLVITTGTVDAVSVVGSVVYSFTVGIIAKSSQVENLTNVGSAIHKASESYTLTTGTQSANLYSDTAALDGVRHTHTDTAGALDLYYEFNVGSGTPSSVQCSMYITGSNDDVDVYGYDWVAAAWVQIGNVQGSNSTTNQVHSFDMYVDMVGSGANEGVVRVRYYKASGLSSATMAIDQVFVAFSQGAEGYDNGAVWLATEKSNTNTVVGVDGVSRNPVSTIGATNTLLASTNLSRIEVSNASSVTLAAAQENQQFKGLGWGLALGGQACTGTFFAGAVVSGTATTSGDEIHFTDCEVGTATLGAAHLNNCGLTSTITLSQATTYTFQTCHSEIAGSASPSIDFGAAIGNTSLNMRRYSGGIEIQNMGAAGTDTMSLEGFGALTINANCTGGSLSLRGLFKVTDNSGGAVTITYDDGVGTVQSILTDTGTTLPATLAAIQAKTDDLTFTKANELDSNIQSINDVTVTGDGSGTPFDV